ncbi:4-(cytidine 5'-diphospho)-2-C-methyl-D-erythritol kinase [Denitrobaculum tricleocarpae]|uniref:4-diphosphocytidyl-2-C-methyl-D-erythritol kinase n=1 Tax=Denitrobaculum tricleocarpae TaxID=2591009 RepID=A0A545U251_9PROT|nr:4-(cytidine 5'-diphospho)-2-C-methyl-D-erythritol kinase [Denitrobaculum tricleocarpae]TQV83514.1 4-(cytidine 5'-diphospho)-2-C-methyl-D-erythritol kinase [Denitrobaculum tricleocarpae]
MITCLAAAKVNLDLRVTGRRPDGYHELDSLVVFPAIGDLLTFEPASDLTLEIDGPRADVLEELSPEDNLVMRAAEALRAAAGVAQGARIGLTKNLPVAAGLGGGSADAAAALTGLSRLWGLTLDHSELLRIGLTLGADVPVCLKGSACYLTGIGEAIEVLEKLPPFWIVLVNPGIALPTPRVFAALDDRFSAARDPSKSYKSGGSREALIAALSASDNDLEAPAMSLVPQIAACIEELGRAPGCLLARMSGSGASCFGLFKTAEAAAAAAAAVQTAEPAWWVADGKVT